MTRIITILTLFCALCVHAQTPKQLDASRFAGKTMVIQQPKQKLISFTSHVESLCYVTWTTTTNLSTPKEQWQVLKTDINFDGNSTITITNNNEPARYLRAYSSGL